MGRGKSAPLPLPSRFCHLAPQPLAKQALVATFFALKTPLEDPYATAPVNEPLASTELAATEALIEELAAESWACEHGDLFDDDYDCDYDDRYDDLADQLELVRSAPRRHVGRARLELEITAGRQRHAHVSVHQVRRAELKTAQRQASLEVRRARVESPLAHCETAPGTPALHAARPTVTRSGSRTPARSGSAWTSGRSVAGAGSWEPSPTPAAAVISTSSGRRVQLSKEEQDVAAAIQASLAVDSNVAGGLTMAQIAELLTRDLSPNDYEMLLQLDEAVQKKTLSTETINKLCPQRSMNVDQDAGGKCTICQCEYESGETLQSTPCAHTFHSDCLVQWLTKSSTKCALCNKALEC